MWLFAAFHIHRVNRFLLLHFLTSFVLFMCFILKHFCCLQVSIRDRVFNSLLFFLEHYDEEVQLKALTGLGTTLISVQ